MKMLERRSGSRFLDEPRAAAGIRDESSRQHFQGNVAVEAGVASAVHFTHTARSEQCQDVISAEPSPSNEGRNGGL
jgi:hypothetical protein